MISSILFFYILYFSIFAFIGWIIESTGKSLVQKKPVNSGFLNGPFIPIFGFGATIILLLSETFHFFPIFLQLIIFTIIVTLLEYFTSYLMENIFSIRLWDYSNIFLNIKGRICLLFSIFWFFLVSLHIIYLSPLAVRAILSLSPLLQSIICIILIIYFIIDTVASGRLYFRFSRIFQFILSLPKSAIRIPIKKGIILRRHLLVPLHRFSYLSKQLQKKFESLPELPLLIKNWLSKSIPLLKGDYQEDKEFQLLLKDTISHPAYQRLKEYSHHDQNIHDHCIKVAWLSYNLARFLSLNVKETIKGALLHDLFYYNWREKDEAHKYHAFTHARTAYKNAVEYFSPLSAIEKDIILKHMWPLSLLPPRYPESILVSLADKMVATREFGKEFANKTVNML